MIELSSFTHREELRQVMARWLINALDAGDAQQLKRLVNFNSLFVRRARECLSRDLLPRIFGQRLVAVPLSTKGELRDLLRNALPVSDLATHPRIAKLVSSYSAEPERFFRETPFEGIALHLPDAPLPLAFSRIKRVRRIAEKCSRRIIDSVFELVQQEARQLASQRASAVGLSLVELSTPNHEREREFVEAEERVLGGLRTGGLFQVLPRLQIDDVLGFKLVGDESVAHSLESTVDAHPDMELVEREEHRRTYQAVNYIILWRCPIDELTRREVPSQVERVLRERGLEGDLTASFREFVRTGDPELRLEIIYQTYEQMLESELGCCLHEERVIQQRFEQAYRGFVVRNIRVLIQYLFCFAISRSQSLDEIPIKLWVRYMPDYHDQVLASVSDFPQGGMGLKP